MKLKMHLTAFFEKAANDPRLGISHICLYLTIVSLWQTQGAQKPLITFAKPVMRLAKIASSATYVRLLRDLCEGGYLGFEASFYNKQPSKIHVLDLGLSKH
jgi:hypothetical protein